MYIRTFLKRGFLFILVVPGFILSAYAQNNPDINNNPVISLAEQLRSFYDIARLPGYVANTIVAQTSTYDTTGGNNDGFSGTYSFIRKDKDSNLVIFDMKGAGVINRIWTPTPTNDTLDFYIDDTVHAAFSIKYTDLFSNKVYPFIHPLCGNELGVITAICPFLFKNIVKLFAGPARPNFTRYNTGSTRKALW